MSQSGRTNLGRWLAGGFLLAIFMGAGPGILLANQPATWFGLPRLYVWGVAWCAVEIAIVVAAYFCVWRFDAENSPESSTDGRAD